MSSALPALLDPDKNPYDFRHKAQEVSKDDTKRLGYALGKSMYDEGQVFLGRDQRTPSEWAYESLRQGLTGAGCDVMTPTESRGIQGAATTGMVAHHTRQGGYAGGVMTTASHMPIGYVGVKPFTEDGIYFSTNQMDDVRRAYKETPQRLGEKNGAVQQYENAVGHFLEDVMTAYKDDYQGRSLDDLSIVVDSGNGVGSLTVPKILQEAGATVYSINDDLKQFSYGVRDPEPTDKALDGLVAAVDELSADIGFAMDGDADRIRLVEGSRKVPGHEVLGHIGASYAANSNVSDGVVFSINTPAFIKEYAESHGANAAYTPVGAIFTAKQCLDDQVAVGGQVNGHMTDGCSDKTPYSDCSAFFSLVLGDIVQETNNLPRFSHSYTRRSHRVDDPDSAFRAMCSTLNRFDDCQSTSQTDDAFKAQIGEGTVLLRQSGTEPVLRVSVESETDTTALQERIEEEVHRLPSQLRLTH